MAETIVKICGLQSVEVIKSLLHFPIDMLGFVFAKSRRQVSADTAAEMVRLLKSTSEEGKQVPESVGIFVNPTLAELAEVLSIAALDVIQLHGQETPEFCRSVKELFPVKVIKTISVSGGARQKELLEGGVFLTETLQQLESYKGSVDLLLLDTYDPVHGGGAGIPFNWEVIPLYQSFCKEHKIPLFIAGGLQEHNVQDLLATFHPDGVDVSSGVETEGIKDLDKIQAFVERVKGK